jgi:hypothetical protein
MQNETMFSKFLKENTQFGENKDYISISLNFLDSILSKIKNLDFNKDNKMHIFKTAIFELLVYYYATDSIRNNKKLALSLCLILINTISDVKFICSKNNTEIVAAFDYVLLFIEQNILEPNNELFNIFFMDISNPLNKYQFELEKLIKLSFGFVETELNKQNIKKYLRKLMITSSSEINFFDIYYNYIKTSP